MWGSGACPQKNSFEQNCLECQKVPLHTIGEMDRVQYEGKFLPLLPPWMSSEGAAVPPVPSRAGVPSLTYVQILVDWPKR